MHWAIGEAVVNTHRPGERITEGFFQGFAAPTTDVPESFRSADVAIFPNPARDYISVSHQLEQKVTGYLINQKGQLVRELDLSAHLTRIDISLLDAGTYHCRVESADGSRATYAIIKI